MAFEATRHEDGGDVRRRRRPPGQPRPHRSPQTLRPPPGARRRALVQRRGAAGALTGRWRGARRGKVLRAGLCFNAAVSAPIVADGSAGDGARSSCSSHSAFSSVVAVAASRSAPSGPATGHAHDGRAGPAVRRGGRRRPASITSTTASSPTSSAAAWRRSTATTTADRSSTSPVAASRRRCFAEQSPIGGALRFERLPDPTTDLDAVTGAYPSTSTAMASRTWRCCATARTCSCAASAIAGSSEPTRPGASTAATSGRRPSRRPGKRARRGRRWPSATITTRTSPTRTSSASPTSSSDRRPARRLRPADRRSDRRRGARSRCSSATGTTSVSAICGSATIITTTATCPMARSSSGR